MPPASIEYMPVKPESSAIRRQRPKSHPSRSFACATSPASGNSARRPRVAGVLVGEVAEVGERADAGGFEDFDERFRILRDRAVVLDHDLDALAAG